MQSFADVQTLPGALEQKPLLHAAFGLQSVLAVHALPLLEQVWALAQLPACPPQSLSSMQTLKLPLQRLGVHTGTYIFRSRTTKLVSSTPPAGRIAGGCSRSHPQGLPLGGTPQVGGCAWTATASRVRKPSKDSDN